MRVPDFIRQPLKGMGTALGRFVTRVFQVAVASVVVSFVLLVLDALLLDDVRREA